MIYKKFQIPCPLPVLDHNNGNLTFNDSLAMHMITLPNNSETEDVNFMMDYAQHNPAGLGEEAAGTLHSDGVEYEAHSADKCQPKYFVFNSRVSNRPLMTEYCGRWIILYKPRHSGIAIYAGPLTIRCCVCFADGLCDSNPSVCFRLPP